MAVDNESVARASARRWATDPEGRTVYYPFGPARSGYLVTDIARENAIRAADRHFDDASRQADIYIYLLFPLVIGVYKYFAVSHPVLACAVFPAALALVGLTTWLLRRPAIAPLLAGLTRVPAVDNSIEVAAYVAVEFFILIGLVLHLYSLRVVAIAASSVTIDFYCDISQDVLFASFVMILLWGLIADWSKRSIKAGSNRTTFGVLLFVLLALIPTAEVAANFYNPKPRVVLSDLTLDCGGNVLWMDINHLTQRSGSKGRQYAQMEFVDNSPFAHEKALESCEIDGLTVDYTDIYQAIYAKWQAERYRWKR